MSHYTSPRRERLGAVMQAMSRRFHTSFACPAGLRLCVAASCLIGLFLAVPVFAQPPEASGTTLRLAVDAEAPGGNAAARDEAVRRARLAGLLDAIELYVDRAQLTDFESLLAAPDAYLGDTRTTDYEVVEGITHVSAEVEVLVAPLRQALAGQVLDSLPQPPRVVLVVATDPGTGALHIGVTQAAQVAIPEVLKDTELQFVPAESLFADFPLETLIECAKGDPEKPVALAYDSMAHVAVMGQVHLHAETPSGAGNIVDHVAELELHVFSSHTAKLVESLKATAKVSGTDAAAASFQAIQDVCRKLAPELWVAIALATGGKVEDPDDIVLTVQGLAERAAYDVLYETVRAIEGVADVHAVYFSERAGRMRVRYTGEIARLVDAILDRPPPGYRLKPHMIVGAQMGLVAEKLPAAGTGK